MGYVITRKHYLRETKNLWGRTKAVYHGNLLSWLCTGNFIFTNVLEIYNFILNFDFKTCIITGLVDLVNVMQSIYNLQYHFRTH